MEFEDTELARLRAIGNSVIAASNRKTKWQCTVAVRRTPDGAHVVVGYRAGLPKPSDPLTYLGDLADTIRNELRLEQSAAGNPIYRTSESSFDSGAEPQFSFEAMPA
ncbi:MAG: hypothetical protein ACR2IE_18770 [Candidatus Sumerlaeaceae bacterium]